MTTPTEPARVAGVLLAAGTSDRFGEENKLLAQLEGEPLVRHAARTLVEAPLEPVVVVLGHEHDRVRAPLTDLPVTFVTNAAYASGQASSVRTGIAAVADEPVDAALVALGDMPFVQGRTLEALVDAYRAGRGDAIAAAFEGTRGNPVIFDRRHFETLTDLEGDVGGRHILLEDDASCLLTVDDPGVRRDIDTPDDHSLVG